MPTLSYQGSSVRKRDVTANSGPNSQSTMIAAADAISERQPMLGLVNESLIDRGTAAYGELKRGSSMRTSCHASLSSNGFEGAPLRRDDGTTDCEGHDCSP
jgi:hypothetical protein